MAIGDDAVAQGYPLVPDQGEDGKVRFGAREINRTRDLIAKIKAVLPTTASGYRTKSGIRSGTAMPSGGSDGDIYFRTL